MDGEGRRWIRGLKLELELEQEQELELELSISQSDSQSLSYLTNEETTQKQAHAGTNRTVSQPSCFVARARCNLPSGSGTPET